MKIGLVLPTASGYTETFFSNKIKGLQANGHTVILFVNNKTQIINDSSIKIKVAPEVSGSFIQVLKTSLYCLCHSLFFRFKTSRQFYLLEKADGISFVERLKHVIINYHILSERLDWLHFGFGTMALGRENVAAAIGAKMAVSFRGFDIGIYPIKHPACYNKLWKKVDKIHVISDDIRNLVYKYGFNGRAPIIKITPAINTTFFKGRHKNIPNVIPQFVTIARLHWKKGLDYTLEALSLIKKENIQFHYTIIGDGQSYERLRFAVYQLGLDDCVTFRGKLSHESVRRQLEQSDIYLQYSIQEGFCNAVLEAQAMGLLCVVSDAEGLGENVLDGITGWVVEKRNPKKLAEKIMEVIELSSSEKNEILTRAQRHVRKNFDLKAQNLAFNLFYS